MGTGSKILLSNDETAREAALEWLLSRVNYERAVAMPYDERQLKLARMRELAARLGQPDAALKIIHVAGTKGKGSTSAMIAAKFVTRSACPGSNPSRRSAHSAARAATSR